MAGAIAANFTTIILKVNQEVRGIIEPFDQDTAMQVKDTAKQQLPGIQQIKRKTISQRLLSIFR